MLGKVLRAGVNQYFKTHNNFYFMKHICDLIEPNWRIHANVVNKSSVFPVNFVKQQIIYLLNFEPECKISI